MANHNASLKQKYGSKFHHFKSLPKEIQDMIWREAMYNTQAHIMAPSCPRPRSRINTVMQACYDARSYGKGNFQYIRSVRAHRQRPWTTKVVDGLVSYTGKHYINAWVDTIWLKGCAFIPESMQICCGRCDRQIFYTRSCAGGLHQVRFNRLAIPFELWQDPKHSHLYARWFSSFNGTATELWRMKNVRELLLVVRKSALTENVFFKRPYEVPGDALYPYSISKYEERGDVDMPVTGGEMAEHWGAMEEAVEFILKKFKAQQESARKFEIEKCGRTEDELAKYGDFKDLSGWEVPRVSFVEAVSIPMK